MGEAITIGFDASIVPTEDRILSPVPAGLGLFRGASSSPSPSLLLTDHLYTNT